jgi:hypothetical protein
MKAILLSLFAALLMVGCGEEAQKDIVEGEGEERVVQNEAKDDLSVPIMIPCEACMKNLSKRSTTCPNCGHPTPASVVAFKKGQELARIRAEEDTAGSPYAAGAEKPASSSVPQGDEADAMSFQEIVDEIKRKEALKVGKYKLSSISETLLKDLASNVHVEVFLSPIDSFPDSLLAKRKELLSLLGQMQDAAKGALRLNVHELESSDPLAGIARKLGIVNKAEEQFYVSHKGHDVAWNRDLYFGTAILGENRENAIISFYDSRMRVEYELIRSILSASGPTPKKRIGIFKTDAPMMGSAEMGMMGISMGGGSPPWEFVTELRKQYDVQEVTGGPINKGDYDALVVVQPSTLDEEKLGDLIAAIKAGVPTAVFEDPLPLIQGGFPGTYEPRRSNQLFRGPGQPPPPVPSKGEIGKLWSLLGVHFNVEPAARLQGIRQELNILKASSNRTLTPLRRQFPEIQKFFTKLAELDKKAGELESRVKANATLTQADWDSLKLDDLRDTVLALDYKHPIRRGVEEKLISPREENLRGLEKLIIRDSFNPFPKIPRTDQFPDEFVYVEGPDEGRDAEGFSSLREIVLLPAAGSLFSSGDPDRDFTPLLSTKGGTGGGTTSLDNFWTGGVFGSPRRFNPDRTLYAGEGNQQVVAASITGKEKDVAGARTLQVALVADADMLSDSFFRINTNSTNSSFPLEVDNVDFILNLMDDVAGGSPLSALRKRRSNKILITSSLDAEIGLLERQVEEDVQEEESILRKKVELLADDLAKSFAKSSETPGMSELARRQFEELQAVELEQLYGQEGRMRGRSEAKIARIKRRKENQTSQLQSAPFSGWIEVHDASGRLRERRHYLGGMPYGQWARFDAKGSETFRKTYDSPNAGASRVDLASIRKAEQDRSEKQQPEVERLQEFFFTTKSGEPIFADLPVTKIAEIEIVESVEGESKTIRLSKGVDGWFIHRADFQYPVDADNQLGPVAESIANLKIHRLETEQEKDHATFGVLDPNVPEEVGKAEGDEDKIGKLLIAKDGGSTALAELILGNKTEDGNSAYRYVRIPGDSIVYSVDFSARAHDYASTQFVQWVEKDFLDLDKWDVKQIHFDNYVYDETQRDINKAKRQIDKYTLAYANENWTSQDVKLAEGESLDKDVLDKMKDALDDLEIIDVAPKPDYLVGGLRKGHEFHDLKSQPQLMGIAQSLSSKGYYVAQRASPGGQLALEVVSNKGEIHVGMKDGVEYVLRFGKVYLGEETVQNAIGDSRYLYALARVNEDLLEAPELEPVPSPLPRPSPSVDADGTETYLQRVADIARVTARNARKQMEYSVKVKKAKARVKELNEKLAGWYYVISNDVYEKIRLERTDFVKAKEKEEGDSKPTEVTASHVLVAHKGASRAALSITRSKEEAKARADSLRKQIVDEGKDFATVARENSDGPTKTKGGDLGKFTFETMVKAFSEAAFALDVGGVSEVVETPFGFHIIKRTE